MRKLWWERNPRSASWGDRLNSRLDAFRGRDPETYAFLRRHLDITCWWVRSDLLVGDCLRLLIPTAMQTHDGQFEYVMMEMDRGLPRKCRLMEGVRLAAWFEATRQVLGGSPVHLEQPDQAVAEQVSSG